MCDYLENYKPIGVIGSGNMGTGIMIGLLAANIVQAKDIIGTNSRNKELEKLKENGVVFYSDNKIVANMSKTIILAVKPGLIHKIINETETQLKGKLLISVASGISIKSIENLIDTPLIRVMPNTAVVVGEGCAAISAGSNASQYDILACKAIFKSVCKVCEVVTEENIDSMIGISGSGIAYIYVVAEALIDAGVKMGMSRDVAKNFVAQTLVGAGRMIQETGEHPMLLKDKVTSPGGTTICGIAKLEELGLRNALIKAAEAAYDKAKNH